MLHDNVFKLKFFIFIVGSGLCASCAVAYFPNARNAPMFSGKGEFQGSVNTFFKNNDLQTAYAVSNHVGVVANAMNVQSWTSANTNSHNYGEIGIGYYRNIEVNWKKSSQLYVDVFGGYGGGNLDVYDDNGPKNLTIHRWFQGSYQKFFIQPGIAFKLDRLGAMDLHLGIVHRVSFVDLSRVSGLAGEKLSTATPITFNKTPLVFHEPAFVIKAVLKEFYLTAQGGVTMTTESVDNYRYSGINLSVGLGLRLNLKKK